MVIPFFGGQSRRGDPWHFVGLSGAFPDVTPEDGQRLADRRPCGVGGGVGGGAAGAAGAAARAPGCKVFQVPKPGAGAGGTGDDGATAEIHLDETQTGEAGALRDQVLVFRYKGKFHAVDNQCPHSAYPLSNGTPFDVEDFGIALSAGITCPKHGWAFDLHSGRADHGPYRLKVWEVELRPAASGEDGDGDGEAGRQEEEKEVWVRRKQRMG